MRVERLPYVPATKVVEWRRSTFVTRVRYSDRVESVYRIAFTRARRR